MRIYRIVIEYTDASPRLRDRPEYWDWYALLADDADETISLISVEDIPTPEGHKENLKDV